MRTITIPLAFALGATGLLSGCAAEAVPSSDVSPDMANGLGVHPAPAHPDGFVSSAPSGPLGSLGPKPDLIGEYVYFGNAYRVQVRNIGRADLPYGSPFRVAVIAGAGSFSRYYSYGLLATDREGVGGESYNFPIPDSLCGQPVTVVVDIDGQVDESNERNNALSFVGGCTIDYGSAGVSAFN